MAWSQTDIDTLKANIAKGVKKLKLSNGEEVEFDSYDQMRRRLADMQAEVSGQSRAGFAAAYPTAGRGL